MKSKNVTQNFSKTITSLLAFFAFFFTSTAQTTITIQATSPSVGNCIPFGTNTSFQFSGMIYRNIPAFTLSPGDKIRFDLGNLNGTDTRRNIYFASANINPAPYNGASQGVKALSWVQVVSDSQIPVNPKGNTTVGDFELTFTATGSFSFSGGGFIIGFGAAPPGPYFDSGCEQNGVLTTTTDPSGYFYERFFDQPNLTPGVLDPFTGSNYTGALQGFKLEFLSQPPVAMCKNATVYLDNAGNASISPSDINNGSSAPAGLASLSVSPNNFTCSNVGNNLVTLTVTDINGDTATCTSTLTVLDTISPQITCPADIIVQAQSNDCSPAVYWSTPVIIENCTYTLNSNFQPGDNFPVGITAVHYSVTDFSGNTENCSFNITVLADTLVASVNAITYASGHNISCNGFNDGEATVSVIGGCLPYTYLWSDMATQTGVTATGLTAGTYTVTVTDANGTITNATIILTEPGSLVVDAGLPQTVYFGYAPAACANLTGTANSGVPAYNYSWSNGATTSATNVCPNVTTNYTLTVTDVNGCIAADEVTICVIDVRCEYGGEVVTFGQGNKVVICHKYDQKNQNTLCVDSSSVADHLAHGDKLGACGINRTCTQQTMSKAAVVDEDELGHTEENNTIRVFPNPSSGSFNIFVNTNETGSINITINSISGQVVFQTTQPNQNKLAQIPVELIECSNGMYFLIVQIGDAIMTEKIVLNK